MKISHIVMILLATFWSLSCDGETADTTATGMEGPTADCPFPTVTFSVANGPLVAVSVNDLTVEEFAGAQKAGVDEVTIVTRRGVRFSRLLELAAIDLPDDTPVNCIARDGWDPLRSRLEGDVSLLPTLAFFRDHAYIYVGSPGEKDPLYPTMEGKSLMVDFDLASDEEVPAYLGGTLPAINIFRFMMVELVDEEHRGILELDPVVADK